MVYAGVKEGLSYCITARVQPKVLAADKPTTPKRRLLGLTLQGIQDISKALAMIPTLLTVITIAGILAIAGTYAYRRVSKTIANDRARTAAAAAQLLASLVDDGPDRAGGESGEVPLTGAVDAEREGVVEQSDGQSQEAAVVEPRGVEADLLAFFDHSSPVQPFPTNPGT